MHIGFVVADFLQYSTQQDNDKLPLTETHSSWFHSNTDWLDSSWIPVESNTGPAQAAPAPATAAANATDCSVYPDESSHLPSRLGSDFDESDDANSELLAVTGESALIRVLYLKSHRKSDVEAGSAQGGTAAGVTWQ